MQYRALGASGLLVSPICLGTMTFGTPVNEAEAIRLIHASIDLGINFIDTANVYEGYARYLGSAGGVAEEIVGKALRDRRDKMIVTTKVGAPVGPDLLPQSFGEPVTGLAPLPAGLPSEVLLRRPDVLAAEHRLRADNANIGAARAAFFPSIKLTGSVGSASDELSGLFDAGTGVWLFAPQVNLPIFEGGRLRANLDVARADRDIALAQYERAIQAGFRDVADALVLTTTLAEQRAARQATVDAATEADRLALARYKAGRDSYLVLLESQRSLYLAQQTLIVTRLSEQANRVTLYKALGGGWLERGP